MIEREPAGLIWRRPPGERSRMIDERLAAGLVGPPSRPRLRAQPDMTSMRARLRSAKRATSPRRSRVPRRREARARVLQALTSAREEEVRIAQVFLRHHPISDVQELRLAAAGIVQMRAPEAQVRALDTLALHRVADGETLDRLARLFPVAATARPVAIAGVLVRADYATLARRRSSP
jgi:hypothetical protein